MVGGPESTTGLTCGRRETVEKCGEQLQEPRRRCERRESRRERKRGEGERKEEKATRCTLCCTYPSSNSSRSTQPLHVGSGASLHNERALQFL